MVATRSAQRGLRARNYISILDILRHQLEAYHRIALCSFAELLWGLLWVDWLKIASNCG
jgi:hypothetical protein